MVRKYDGDVQFSSHHLSLTSCKMRGAEGDLSFTGYLFKGKKGRIRRPEKRDGRVHTHPGFPIVDMEKISRPRFLFLKPVV